MNTMNPTKTARTNAHGCVEMLCCIQPDLYGTEPAFRQCYSDLPDCGYQTRHIHGEEVIR